MKIEFNVKPYQGCMNVKITYDREEVKQDYFYLNRDFVINHCLADDEKYDISNEIELSSLDNYDGYQVNKYFLPQFHEQFTLEYTGYLTGKTGLCPYVRETISPDFTFLRFETFCYPLFFDDSSEKTLSDFLRTRLTIDVTVIMPEEFTAVSCMPEVAYKIENGIKKQLFWSDRHDLAIAVAKYTVKKLSFGNFYLLNEIDGAQLENTMKIAHSFMNEHFGVRDISARTNYAAIPNHYGSFATAITVFIDESTFDSIKSMNQIIHEFIHLGWNVKTDSETQRIRFFDEAFTCYFEMRVMEHLMKDSYRYIEYIEAYKNQLTRYDGNVPIIEFGRHGYGDLSYTIGAICLYKLSEFVGVEIFERATREFLQKYKDTPVNMQIFCDDYISLCHKPGLEQFFKDWIYTTNGPKSLIGGYKIDLS